MGSHRAVSRGVAQAFTHSSGGPTCCCWPSASARGRCVWAAVSSLAGLVLGLTFLAHFIYGWMGAWTALLITLIPGSAPLRQRLGRVAWIGLVACLSAAFQLRLLLEDLPYINHSRWEHPWKWASFGAREVLSKLVQGELLDHGRFPVLSLLALAGALVVLFTWHSTARAAQGAAGVFVLVAACFWLVLYCGRATWGSLFDVLGASPDMHLHRLIGAVQIFLIFLAAIGLGWLWGAVARKIPQGGGVVAGLLLLMLLSPALRERFLDAREGQIEGEKNLAAWHQEGEGLEELLRQAGERPGRLYPGMAAGFIGGWGNQLRVGAVPVHARASVRRLPAVSFLYHTMSLTADVMAHFDDRRIDHYRLFAVHSVILRRNQRIFTLKGQGSHPSGLYPAFLDVAHEAGRFRLLRASVEGRRLFRCGDGPGRGPGR